MWRSKWSGYQVSNLEYVFQSSSGKSDFWSCVWKHAFLQPEGLKNIKSEVGRYVFAKNEFLSWSVFYPQNFQLNFRTVMHLLFSEVTFDLVRVWFKVVTIWRDFRHDFWKRGIFVVFSINESLMSQSVWFRFVVG